MRAQEKRRAAIVCTSSYICRYRRNTCYVDGVGVHSGAYSPGGRSHTKLRADELTTRRIFSTTFRSIQYCSDTWTDRLRTLVDEGDSINVYSGDKSRPDEQAYSIKSVVAFLGTGHLVYDGRSPRATGEQPFFAVAIYPLLRVARVSYLCMQFWHLVLH